jgi:hypothetical protein
MPMDLNDQSVFAAVVRAGGFRRRARERHVPDINADGAAVAVGLRQTVSDGVPIAERIRFSVQ